ncbi:MAG: RpiB/LacA/LacB family sugar-phosphate isomerase [Alphaproteobacteria bacterium]|nr:RpiB/LacA/LacB family sugar-phosphate isomerase [Alphaproteobacteria bacterium]
MQTILMAADHGGANLKNILKSYLQKKGLSVVDYGPENADTSVDYPDKALELIKGMQKDESAKGILVCTSGIGMSIAANRYPFLRGALVFNPEMAEMARGHNNANVLIFGAKFISEETAKKCVDVFLSTEFLGGRHERRVNKLSCMGGEK